MAAGPKRLPAGLRRYQSRLAETKRAALVEAAGRIFLARGYDEATVGAIAQDAKVSLATLYKHFPTKGDLFGAVVEQLAGTLTDIAGLDDVGGGDATAVLRRLARGYAAILRRPDTVAIFRIVIAEGPRFPELGEMFRAGAKEAVGQKLKTFLAERAARGEVAIDDPERALGRFFGVFDHFLLWPGLIDPAWRASDKEAKQAAEDAIAALLACCGRPLKP